MRKETACKYFESGYVEGTDDAVADAPEFFENLLSGRSKMVAWRAKQQRRKNED